MSMPDQPATQTASAATNTEAATPLQRMIDSLCGKSDNQFMTIVTSLTLATLIFHGYRHAYFAIPFQILAVAFLVLPALQRNGTYWFLITCFCGAAVWLNWHQADNHKYLLFYWTFVLYLALDDSKAPRREVIRSGAYYLLLFTMFLAVIQKTISVDYLSGSFFEVTFLTDSRFSAFSALLTDMDSATLAENRNIYRQAMDPMFFDQSLMNMVSSAQLHMLALVVSWINYLDQLAIALMLLVPLSTRWEIAKHLLLMVFIIGVYAVAPVIGFGWLIIIWGYCLVPENLLKLRLGYVALFFLLCAYEFPWLSLLVPA